MKIRIVFFKLSVKKSFIQFVDSRSAAEKLVRTWFDCGRADKALIQLSVKNTQKLSGRNWETEKVMLPNPHGGKPLDATSLSDPV